MLSAPMVAAFGLSVLAPLWLLAGAAGMLLTGRHYRHRARDRGVTGRGRRAWAIAWGMFLGCLAAGAVGGAMSGEAAGVLAPIIVVIAGYLALGWSRRSFGPALAVAPGAALAVALVLAGVAPWLVELTFGGALVLAGIAIRAAETRS